MCWRSSAARICVTTPTAAAPRPRRARPPLRAFRGQPADAGVAVLAHGHHARELHPPRLALRAAPRGPALDVRLLPVNDVAHPAARKPDEPDRDHHGSFHFMSLQAGDGTRGRARSRVSRATRGYAVRVGNVLRSQALRRPGARGRALAGAVGELAWLRSRRGGRAPASRRRGAEAPGTSRPFPRPSSGCW